MNTIRIIYNHVFIWLGNSLPRFEKFNKMRCNCYRLAGLSIGKNFEIAGPLNVRPDTTPKVFIGDGTYLNTEIRFGCQKDEIKIGKKCLIGPRVSFETASHEIYYEIKRDEDILLVQLRSVIKCELVQVRLFYQESKLT